MKTKQTLKRTSDYLILSTFVACGLFFFCICLSDTEKGRTFWIENYAIALSVGFILSAFFRYLSDDARDSRR